MGLTKQYLRYTAGPVFNIIANSSCPYVFHVNIPTVGSNPEFVLVAACEDVIVWDLRKGEKHIILPGDKDEVTAFSVSPSHFFVAIGYKNGFIRLFCLRTRECTLAFSGHKSAVTCLAFNGSGTQLASGSKDTELIVWDVVSESGIVRLRGHKHPVTKCSFMKTRNWLVSSSRDTFVKFWDLDTQHCFYTLVGHRSEVWDFAFLKNETLLVTGCKDVELHFWNVSYKEQEFQTMVEEEDAESAIISCSSAGTVVREGRDRLISLRVDESERILCFHGSDSFVEMYKILTDEETKLKIKKRLKKEKKKGLTEDPVPNLEPMLTDHIRKLPKVSAKGKVKAIAIAVNNTSAKMYTVLHNNALETHSVELDSNDSSAVVSKMFWSPGHRTDVRTVSFSSDNSGVVSASADSVKLWNRATQQCIRTIGCSNALSSCFTPGDRHCLIGTKAGKIDLFDLAGGTMLESFSAHEGPVWSLCLTPDQRGFVSGSGDKEVKFWDFDLVHDEARPSATVLSATHTRTLKMSEDVLSVKISPNHRHIAVALLDNTVKVFFVDTLKFFLSLYGHTLPVLCMDISHDNSILISGSADRNVKIWGLDFGDCRRSLFAHEDSITCVQFIPETHLFFTGGKDGRVNQWDADSFEKIISLQGHHGEVWSLSISPNGHHVVSASHDKSLRLWERTEEPLILEEQREMEREEEEEKNLVTADSVVHPGQDSSEATIAGQKTIETIKAAEKLMEALDVYAEEKEKLAEYKMDCAAEGKALAPPQQHPLMIAYKASSPEHFVLEILKKIKSSEMDKGLLVIPFDYVIRFLKILGLFLDKGWETELVCRCIFFLIRIHNGQIVSNQVLVPVIEKLKEKALERLNELKDIMSFNMAGLSFIKQEIESTQQVMLFVDASRSVGEKRKKRQKAEKLMKRAVLAL